MPITLNGDTGITTPGLINTGSTTLINLTTTGNTILGDQSTDTLNVANGNLVLNSSGNLGIGISSPTQRLHVVAAGGYNATFSENSANNVRLQLYVDANETALVSGYNTTPKPMTFYAGGSLRATLDTSGNLGLGVIPSGNSLFEAISGGAQKNIFQAWYGSSNNLPFAIATDNANGQAYLGWNTKQGASATQTYLVNNFANKLDVSSGEFRFNTAGLGTAGNAISFAQVMTLTANGRLGIGVTTPQASLHVSNGSNSDSGNFTGLVIGGTDINARTASFIKNTSSPYDFTIRSQNFTAGVTGSLIFQNGSTEHARINSSGNMGIGTSGPLTKLDVRGASNTAASTIQVVGDGVSTLLLGQNAAGGVIRGQGGSNVLSFWTGGVGDTGAGQSGTEKARIDSVGSFIVDPEGYGGIYLKLNVSSPGDGHILLQRGGSNRWQITSSASNNLQFYNYATGSESVRIDSSGRMLVGATSFTSYGTFNSYTNSTFPAGRFASGPSTPDGNIVLMVDKHSSTNTTSQWFLGFTIANTTVASGVITANGASQAAFGAWSDRRLKENIVDLPPQLENIMALRPVEFDYIASEGGGHQISFIAQEFEQVYSDAVGERADGMKTLTGWGKTEARLVKAIQELKAELDSVKSELATIKGAA